MVGVSYSQLNLFIDDFDHKILLKDKCESYMAEEYMGMGIPQMNKSIKALLVTELKKVKENFNLICM